MADPESVGESRALITETERENLTGANGNDRKYQAASRIRRRINNELTSDVSLLEEHHTDLLAELRDIVCEGDEKNGVLQRIIGQFTPTTESDGILADIPSEADLIHLYDRLLYSSSMVEQSYMDIIGRYEPANVSDRYHAAAVLQQREMGVGVTPFDEFDNEHFGTKDVENAESNAPTVFRMTGDLMIKSKIEEEIETEAADWGDMFVNKLRADGTTFVDFGSVENYHPLIQRQVTDGEPFHAGSAVGYFIEFNRQASDEGKVHFMQLALQE